MGYMSNVKKQYWISFFHSLIPAYVIERLFNFQRGMNVQTIVYAEIIYAFTVTVFEIPSGIMADSFGRKRMLVISGVLAAAELLLVLFAHSFLQFAAAIFLAGVSTAFSSGSENALLYDSLLHEGRQDDFEKLLGRLSAVDFIGSTAAALGGGVLANFFDYEFNYIISIFSMCTAAAVALTLKEPPVLTKSESEISGAARYAKQAVSVFRSQPTVLLFCLTGAVLGACMTYLDEFWQVVSDNVGIPVMLFGAIGVSFGAVRTPGALLAHKLKEKFGYRRILTCLIAVSAVGYAAVFFVRNAFCLVPMLPAALAAGIADPLVAGYLHRHTDSDIRATVESFSSLGLRVAAVGVGLLFGRIAAERSIFAGFLALGAVCFGYLGLFALGGGKYFRGEKEETKRKAERRRSHS
ncbi:MAG: MFS transporter [Oscillospiraceae bacterium]|jgi:MFS family permease|nr:MFS transporter [Oscillospiraceae bacterium]